MLFILFFFTACEKKPNLTVKISGEESYLFLIQEWADTYNDVQKDELIVFNDAHIEDLFSGKSDIFYSHNQIDFQLRKKVEVEGYDLTELPMVRDGVTFVVPTTSRIEYLKYEDIEAIFSGKITVWDSISYQSGIIRLFADKSDIIHNKYFENKALTEGNWSQTIEWLPSQKAVIDSVKNVNLAIGLLSLSSPMTAIKDVKILSLIQGEELFTPLQFNYAFSYPIYFYHLRQNATQLNNFISFCTSQKGKSIAMEEGIVPFF